MGIETAKQFQQRKHRSHTRAMGENGDSPNGFFRFPRGVWTPIDSRMAAYYSQRRRLQSGVKQFEF